MVYANGSCCVPAAARLARLVQPLQLLRRLGVRTRSEIDQEKYALKAFVDRSANAR